MLRSSHQFSNAHLQHIKRNLDYMALLSQLLSKWIPIAIPSQSGLETKNSYEILFLSYGLCIEIDMRIVILPLHPQMRFTNSKILICNITSVRRNLNYMDILQQQFRGWSKPIVTSPCNM